MFRKILVANRGEIACRIISTAKKMGIQTVAVYSEADRHALHVKMANEAYCLGAAPSAESYLRADRVINAAVTAGAEAIHPGYGFLAENAAFAEQCATSGLIFIGPSPRAIRAMGEKHTAKHIMEKAGVPIIPGYQGEEQDLTTLQTAARNMGYPVLIKAVAGGGGKGMRVVNNDAEFAEALTAAQREAKASFGNDQVLLEKYLSQPRHVEVQVFADNHGHSLYLFERDCSIQRRHQKILEEAPAPGMTAELRNAMGEAAVNAAKAIDYSGAGTIEFLLVPNGEFYFMEMNTRLQVEHPVTEKITGLDLVEWQLRVAAGEFLPITQQAQLPLYGHAIEARICAEDPSRDFMPSIGALKYMRLPSQNNHVRVDSGVVQGDSISVYYDPLLAKLIVWDETRDKAINRLTEALAEFQIVGVQTNTEFLKRIIGLPSFAAAELDTHFIPRHPELFASESKLRPQTIAIAGLALFLQQQREALAPNENSQDHNSPWHSSDSFRLNLNSNRLVRLKHEDQEFSVKIILKKGKIAGIQTEEHTFAIEEVSLNDQKFTVSLDGSRMIIDMVYFSPQLHLFMQGNHWIFTLPSIMGGEHESDTSNRVLAPMPGSLTAVFVSPGQQVKKGERLLVVEAMKMQHTLYALADGQVQEIFYGAGDLIDEGVELLKWEE